MGRTNVYGKRGDGMKATGIVRRIDELGRIVIPKEIRRTLRIRESDPVEIYMGEAGEILLKKYSPLLGLQDVAEEYAQALNGAFGLTSAICDRESVVAAAGRERRWLQHKALLPAFQKGLSRGQVMKEPQLSLTEDQPGPFSRVLAVPIVLEGECVGGVCLCAVPGGPGIPPEAQSSLQIAALFLQKLINT